MLDFHEHVPIVHNITNYVAMNFTANAILAVGASPIMSSCPEEMEDLAALCDSLVVNIGCLDREQLKAAETAVSAMGRLGKPWILDPVGAGASRLRTEVSADLVLRFKPAIIRCNSSEAAFLAGALGLLPSPDVSRGVDASVAATDMAAVARTLAGRTGSVVCISGEKDAVSDGIRTERICGGHPMMARVTATGCVGSALCGVFAAVEKDYFVSACRAASLVKVAGASAASRCRGTGSFVAEFLDALGEASL